MQRFAAETYLNVASNLGAIAQQLAAAPIPMSRTNLQGLAKQFLERAKECRAIDLQVSAGQFEIAAGSLEEISPFEQFQAAQAATMIVDLQNAMMCEMKDHLFLWVRAGKAKYYEQPYLFGKEVVTQFPSTAQDIRAAGNCFASDNNTACVFHCMRVLEKGLQVFANHLQIPFAIPVDLQNWQNIIEPIEKEIAQREKSLPKGRSKSDELKFLSGAAVQFRYFKEAWRNHVAHARVTYDETNAQQVLAHVHQFMVELATNGLKE
jgi:hypothetical protein